MNYKEEANMDTFSFKPISSVPLKHVVPGDDLRMNRPKISYSGKAVVVLYQI